MNDGQARPISVTDPRAPVANQVELGDENTSRDTAGGLLYERAIGDDADGAYTNHNDHGGDNPASDSNFSANLDGIEVTRTAYESSFEGQGQDEVDEAEETRETNEPMDDGLFGDAKETEANANALVGEQQELSNQPGAFSDAPRGEIALSDDGLQSETDLASEDSIDGELNAPLQDGTEDQSEALVPYNNEVRRAIVDGAECYVIWLPELHKAPPPYWRQKPNYKPEILRKSGWRIAINSGILGWCVRSDRSGIVQPTEFLKD